MPPVPLLRSRDAVRAFERLGRQVRRQKGCHIILTRPGHITTISVPNHPQVARGTLRAPITKAGLTVDEFTAVLER